MASVTTLPDGKRRVQFISPGGARRTVHLGKVEKKYADAVCTRVESILGAQMRGDPLDRDTSSWLGSIPDPLHKKLAAVGLTKARQCRTLGEWMVVFMESRADLKPESRRKLEQTRAKLEAFFGKDRLLQHISAEDASRWRDPRGCSTPRAPPRDATPELGMHLDAVPGMPGEPDGPNASGVVSVSWRCTTWNAITRAWGTA